MKREGNVIYRDKLGRKRVDLRQIRSPWLRYGLALSVVALVFGLAWWAGRDQVRSDDDFAWLVPWLGGGAVLILGLGVLARLFGGKR